MREKKRKRHIFILLTLFITAIAFFIFEDKHLVVSEYIYISDKVGPELEGLKIVQISDLHNASFGKDNIRLINTINEQRPDIIVITGDLVDSNHTDIEKALNFAQEMAKKYPVYYITGNHEYWLSEDDRNEMLSGLSDMGVVILNDEAVTISIGNDSFNLVGLDNNSLQSDILTGIIAEHEEELNIVLAHEPQYINRYSKAGADLVLAGHVHGGQFRLPFVGGILAPEFGFFPQYDAGMYTENGTTMVVSRGIGNSVIPVRIYNFPEIVCIELNQLCREEQ